MQSVFHLPWSTQAPGDKIMEKATFAKSRNIPTVDIPLLSKLKRKRTGSPDPVAPHAQTNKKWKGALSEVKPPTVNGDGVAAAPTGDGVAAPVTAPATPVAVEASRNEAAPPRLPDVEKAASSTGTTTAPRPSKPTSPSAHPQEQPTPTDDALPTSALTPLQQAIEAQFSYEILLKHNELRLIEQEMAKCQIALEQLRRCQLIPYPGTEGPSPDVSRGVGPALQPRPGFTEPQYPAPWGVTDGPYTRHYAKWLIPDPKFDSVPEQQLMQQHRYYGSEGRTTRGSISDHHVGGKARTSRTSTGGLKFPALGENPAPVPKQDPLLHKRSTDGQWVRLYCAACKHSNFSNTQGFLNHCRIKHGQVFKSHDAAAIACGVPVDTDELGVALPPSEPLPTPSAGMAGSPLVHPLIRNNPPPRTSAARASTSQSARAAGTGPSARPTPAASTPSAMPRDYGFPPPSIKAEPAVKVEPQSAAAPFVPSTQTPHLSALFQKFGVAGDLKQAVENARTKIDLDSLDPPSDDEQSTLTSGQRSSKATPTSEHGPLGDGHARAGGIHFPSHRPSSKKGSRLPNQIQPPPPLKQESRDSMAPVSPTQLSPHTVESNPGLMSDDEDEEEDDDAKSIAPHQSFDMDMDDVIVQDGSDVENGDSKHKDMFCGKPESSRKD